MDNPVSAQRRARVWQSPVVHAGPHLADDTRVVRWMTGSCPLTRSHMSTAFSTVASTASARLEALDNVGDLLVDRLALAHLALDLLHGVDHGRVVTTTEESGDAGIAQVGLLAEHVHRDLATGHERPLAALALQGLDLEAEVTGDLGQ